MIIGGIGGVDRIGSSRTGYRETYLQGKVPTASINIHKEPVTKYLYRFEYKASGGAWTELDNVSSFSITKNSDGTNACSLTISGSSSDYPAGGEMAVYNTVDSVEYEIFSGTIDGGSDAVGFNGAQASITVKGLGNTEVTHAYKCVGDTTKRSIFNLIEADVEDPLFIFFCHDLVREFTPFTISFCYNVFSRLVAAMIGFIPTSISYTEDITMVAFQPRVTTSSSVLFDDTCIESFSRSSPTTAYNTIRMRYRLAPGGTYQYLVFEDAADVARRGDILGYYFYFETLDAEQISYFEDIANELIASSLAGEIYLTIKPSPALEVGMACTFQSDKLGITAFQKNIRELRHSKKKSEVNL